MFPSKPNSRIHIQSLSYIETCLAQIIKRNNRRYVIICNNGITKAKILFSKVLLNQTHLNSDDYVDGVLNFGGVTYMTEVM